MKGWASWQVVLLTRGQWRQGRDGYHVSRLSFPGLVLEDAE